MTLRNLTFAAAAVILLVPAPIAAWAAESGMASAMQAPTKIGDLEITASFARATLPGAPTGGAYITIQNTGNMPDTLVAATSPGAGSVSLHTMSMDGAVMKMEALPQGIPIPAGATVTMTPDGLHLMFEHLAGPFVEGKTIAVTLVFAKAGSAVVNVPILGFGAQSPMAGPMAGMAM